MRSVIGSLVAACLLLSAAERLATKQNRPQAASSLPNILFLISDDHSASDVGCYGNPVVHTPNLDHLARDGARFTNAFVTSPQCSPSRSSIVTGQAPHSTGTSRLHSPLRPRYTNVIDLLKSAGYFTGAYRKIHLGEEFQKKFDFYGDAKESFAAFFERRPKDKPFFLHLGFTDPHRPYQKGAFSPPHDPAKVAVPEFLPNTPEVREDLALYYDEIARMDKEVAEVLALLEKHGLAENTLVIFTADNGMPFPGGKGTLYDAGIKVPLIARWPEKIKPGQVVDELISLVDLAPTWLEAASIPVPETMQGRSFLNLLLGKPYQPREAIFSERNWHDNFDVIRCVRTKQYKLIQNYRPEVPYRPILDLANSPTWKSILTLKEAGKLDSKHLERFFLKPRPQVELYDLQKDPDEFKNLADDPAYAEIVFKLQELLSKWINETNDFVPPPRGAFPPQFKNVNPL